MAQCGCEDKENKSIFDIVKAKYDYMSDDDINLLIDRAKAICVDYLYPADLSINYLTFNFNNPRFKMWIIDCVDELVDISGVSSFVSYKENGMSWTRDNAGSISFGLLNRLPKIVGTIGEDDEEW